MTEGLAEYRENGKVNRILILENAIKQMDTTFPGCPVYVQHVNEVDLGEIEKGAPRAEDGWVMESFFNDADGKHWTKFIVLTDEGHDAIQKGWTLSNAYKVKRTNDRPSEWHGVPYDQEVMEGEYEHLAIVPNPRYTESKVLTPEQFKAHNSQKKAELLRLANSKDDNEGDPEMKLPKFFNRTEVGADLQKQFMSLTLTLDKSGKEISVAKLVNDMDELMAAGGYANGEHKFKVGDEEMSVNDLAKKYTEMKNKFTEVDKADEEAAEGEPQVATNEEDEEEKKKKENEKADMEAKEKEKKQNALDNYKKLQNAGPKPVEGNILDAEEVDLHSQQLARGQARYGKK